MEREGREKGDKEEEIEGKEERRNGIGKGKEGK